MPQVVDVGRGYIDGHGASPWVGRGMRMAFIYAEGGRRAVMVVTPAAGHGRFALVVGSRGEKNRHRHPLGSADGGSVVDGCCLARAAQYCIHRSASKLRRVIEPMNRSLVSTVSAPT